MSEKDYKKLMELVEKELAKKVTKEEALRALQAAGILTKSGNYTSHYPTLKKAAAKNR
jgi:hypothetical protein